MVHAWKEKHKNLNDFKYFLVQANLLYIQEKEIFGRLYNQEIKEKLIKKQ